MSALETPRVSFIIASYNHGSYIAECIESILSQHAIRDFEIIVIDDASPDDTLAQLKQFADPRLRVIRNTQNRGHVATLNVAMAAARGKFIARQDSDNRYRPDFLRTTLEIFQQQPQVGLVYGDVAALDVSSVITSDPWAGVRAQHAHDGKPFCGNEFIPILVEDYVPIVALLARREAWAEAFPLPAWFPRLFIADDWYALTRMMRKYDSYYVPRALTDYRLHAHNLHRRFDNGALQEKTLLKILDDIYAQPERRAEKERVRAAAYAVVYGGLAPRYLMAGNLEDARRCYLRAFRLEPRRLLNGYAARAFASTFIGTTRYQNWKTRLGYPKQD